MIYYTKYKPVNTQLNVGLVLRWQFVNSPKQLFHLRYSMICFFCKIPSSVRPDPNVMALYRYLNRVYVYNQMSNDFLINVVSVLLYTPQYWCIKKTNNSKHSNYMYLLCRDLPQRETLPSWIFSSSKKYEFLHSIKKPLLYYRFLIHEIYIIITMEYGPYWTMIGKSWQQQT